jgi:periplasmic protein TonB
VSESSPPSPPDTPLERVVGLLRRNAFPAGLVVVLLALGALGVRWIARNRESPPPRKVMQFSMVTIQPRPPEKPPPPPPPVPPPKVQEEETTRVNLKPQDLLPPDEPRPASPPAGPLALAAEGEGPGDAFNLAGNPGGRGLLSGGGLGDGSGGLGGGGGNPFGWYYAQVADELGEALRRNKRISSASLRVELRLWTDPAGRVSKVQLLRSTGDPEVDQAIQSVVGLRLRQPPPPGSPMPMVLRVTARRPT